jgi:hypothetical protein
MKRLFWSEGRLSWALVATVVFVTVSVLSLDLVWRTVEISFDTLLVYAVAANISAALVLTWLFVRFRRQP